MPVPTPFHNRLLPYCKSLKYKEWAGYYAAEKYETVHDNEYYALRQAAGLIDVSPLYKYDIEGPDAARLLDRLMTRQVSKLKVGQVGYTAWCDDYGKIIDDGTVTRLEDEHYRVTAASPTLRWFVQNSDDLDVEIADTSRAIGALAIQGPLSRDVLRKCLDFDIGPLKFFQSRSGKLGTVDCVITRTGYTGDLGYEVWVDARDADKAFDTLMDAGKLYSLTPCGLNALDMARIEAGFILADVDYTGAKHAFAEHQKSTPYEVSLGWTVQLDRPPFIGQQALMKEKKSGSAWQLVGIEIDYVELEKMYDSIGLPIGLPHAAWRCTVPIYEPGYGSRPTKQVGRATSGVWSPMLKKNLALATLEAPVSAEGTELRIEWMVDYDRRYVPCKVVPKPFFDPPRKKSTEPARTEQTAREAVKVG